MERKIGEIFTYNGKLYQAAESYSCKNCAFSGKLCGSLLLITGNCISDKRTDKTNVAFKEINNMENNQLTIDIPEGMEIDLENSDLTKGIIRFKQITITYENVEDALKLGKNCKSIIINENNAPKLVNLSKLMNIAKYYNGDWKPDWSRPESYKFYIQYNTRQNAYVIDYGWHCINSDIYFKDRKDAQAVIDNPNFRDILDKIYMN